jgi:aspartyl-tRNA(Asn)/glutamyl-tRNA(Gln) amidotransferase subunit B
MNNLNNFFSSMEINLRKKYKAIIGLEIHAQLLLESKMFAPEPATYGALPNTQISTISLAHPGTLPRINKKAVEYAIKLGLACKCSITRENFFARKNYFYPDLSKGYQITQDKTPICQGGYVTINAVGGQEKNISLRRIHMEEDTGKSIHGMIEGETLLDFNRAGVALLEIVTEPEIANSEEAYQFLTEFRKLVRYLEICDGNMEEGSLRCDANVSVMHVNATEFGQKVEVKNINSIRNVQLAIEHEISRQISLIEAGGKVIAETRSFEAATGQTVSQRTKETALDYRYFPEPDLPVLMVTDRWIEQIRQELPLLPRACYHKFIQEYQIPAYDAAVLSENKGVALFFEELCNRTLHHKAAANWVMGPVKAYLNELNLTIQEFPLTPAALASLVDLVEQGQISFSSASQKLYPALLAHPSQDPFELAESMNLLQEKDTQFLKELIEDVIAAYPDKVAAYKSGKTGILGMLMGEVMKKSQGKAAPKLASDLIKARLEA